MPDFFEMRRGFLHEDVRSASDQASLDPMTDAQIQRMVARLVYLMDRDKFDVITMPLDSFRGMYTEITTHTD